MNPEPPPDVLAMGTDGVDGDEQLLPNGKIGTPRSDQGEDFPFAGGKLGEGSCVSPGKVLLTSDTIKGF